MWRYATVLLASALATGRSDAGSEATLDGRDSVINPSADDTGEYGCSDFDEGDAVVACESAPAR